MILAMVGGGILEAVGIVEEVIGITVEGTIVEVGISAEEATAEAGILAVAIVGAGEEEKYHAK
jgi:hypothetical protein